MRSRGRRALSHRRHRAEPALQRARRDHRLSDCGPAALGTDGSGARMARRAVGAMRWPIALPCRVKAAMNGGFRRRKTRIRSSTIPASRRLIRCSRSATPASARGRPRRIWKGRRPLRNPTALFPERGNARSMPQSDLQWASWKFRRDRGKGAGSMCTGRARCAATPRLRRRALSRTALDPRGTTSAGTTMSCACAT
jgi:hypothetical protein